VSSGDSYGDPPEFHEAARPPASPKRTESSTPVTCGSPAGAGGELPKPLIAWNSSLDQMLIDAFAREGETAPSWLTNPIFLSDGALAPAPPAYALDRPFGLADLHAGHEGLAPVDLFSEPDRPLFAADPITAPNQAVVLADPSSSLDEPPSWLYQSGVPSRPDHLTDLHRRSIAWRRHLPVVAAVGLVVTVGVGSAILLGRRSGSTPSNRQPVAIASQTTTSSPGSAVSGTEGAATATTGGPPTATTDPATIASISPGSVGAQSAGSQNGRTTGGVAAGSPPATRPPSLTQAPPPTQPPTTPTPPTTVTTLPPITVTTRPPRTITTPPLITRPTLPQTPTTTRPHH
jgi:hypothetical protein